MNESRRRLNKGIHEVLAKSRINNIDTEKNNLEEVFKVNWKKTKLKERYFIEEEIKYYNAVDRDNLDPENGDREKHDLYLKFLNSKMKGLGSISTKDKYSENWFVVGKLFANGEMEVLLKKFDRNFTQIAKHLKPNTSEGKEPYKGIRPYISQSANNTTITDKNIFSSPNKILLIQQYCIDNHIEMTDHFKSLNQPV